MLNWLLGHAFEIALAMLVVAHMLHMRIALRQIKYQVKRANEEFDKANVQFDRVADGVQRIVDKVVDKVDELERSELLHALVSTAESARHSLIHYTYTFRLPSEEPEMGPLLSAMTNTRLDKRKVRLIGPDYHSNLNRLYMRKKTGVCLRVNHSVANSDIRFQVADGRHVVLTIGSASGASRRGFLIDSVFLADILTDWFNVEWTSSTEYDEFVASRILKAACVGQIANKGEEHQIDYVAKRLDLDIEEVRRLWTPVPTEPEFEPA